MNFIMKTIKTCPTSYKSSSLIVKSIPFLLLIAIILLIVELTSSAFVSVSKLRFTDDVDADAERTFLMIKPDGFERGLIAEVIKRFEVKGFKLVGIKVMVPSQELLHEHYAEHALKPFFPSMMSYMSMGPVVPMVWEGLNAVNVTREMIGGTHRDNEPPGTIRGDYSINTRSKNIIHGSDSLEAANREINLWFKQEELISFKFNHEKYLYDRD